MVGSNAELEAGSRRIRGLLHCYARADEAQNSLTNVGIWRTLADGPQMDWFQAMPGLGKTVGGGGAAFEGPIVNHASLWEMVSEVHRAAGWRKHSQLLVAERPGLR